MSLFQTSWIILMVTAWSANLGLVDSIQCYSCKATGPNEMDANIQCLEKAYLESCDEFYNYYNDVDEELYEYYYNNDLGADSTEDTVVRSQPGISGGAPASQGGRAVTGGGRPIVNAAGGNYQGPIVRHQGTAGGHPGRFLQKQRKRRDIADHSFPSNYHNASSHASHSYSVEDDYDDDDNSHHHHRHDDSKSTEEYYDDSDYDDDYYDDSDDDDDDDSHHHGRSRSRSRSRGRGRGRGSRRRGGRGRSRGRGGRRRGRGRYDSDEYDYYEYYEDEVSTTTTQSTTTVTTAKPQPKPEHFCYSVTVRLGWETYSVEKGCKKINYCKDALANKPEWGNPWNFCCDRSRCNVKLVKDKPQRVFGMGCRRTDDCIQGHNTRPVCPHFFKSCPRISRAVVKMECRQSGRATGSTTGVAAKYRHGKDKKCFCSKGLKPKGPICTNSGESVHMGMHLLQVTIACVLFSVWRN